MKESSFWRAFSFFHGETSFGNLWPSSGSLMETPPLWHVTICWTAVCQHLTRERVWVWRPWWHKRIQKSGAHEHDESPLSLWDFKGAFINYGRGAGKLNVAMGPTLKATPLQQYPNKTVLDWSLGNGDHRKLKGIGNVPLILMEMSFNFH